MNNNQSILTGRILFLSIFFCFGSYCLGMCQTYVPKRVAGLHHYTILTPEPSPQPRINGPLVYGVRPGHPFLYRIPCQGKRPIEFTAQGLPQGFKLNRKTGIITGTVPPKGEYEVTLKAVNDYGSDVRTFKVIAGDKLALTPPMGWNDWYAYYDRITDKKVRQAADAMVQSGMADVGYQYVNIDDTWQRKPSQGSPVRDKDGNILPNKNFPNMKALTGYIHSLGLKAGIYSSPGPLTCGGYEGSYGHERQDAVQYARWGFDFLKYDWCSYGKIARAKAGKEKLTLREYQKPYLLMGNSLQSLNRDIVYNLCQYGMADVWEWGAKVHANTWRTGGDLGYALTRLFKYALKNASHYRYSRPGEWNDPDYIQIGWIGSAHSYGTAKLTKMPPGEQYAYMSLWCLMAAPLFYSGDMTRLDNFTLNVLENPEVIAVDQDPLGKGGRVVMRSDSCFVMMKELADGSKAVGLFNAGYKPATVTATWKELNISGDRLVRDLWRQIDAGIYRHRFSAVVPARGVILVKMAGIKSKDE